jgi:DNA-binding IclR family transcriptional regulator
MRSVKRAFSVLHCFSPASLRLTLQEIADRLGLAKSTAFRLVNTLEQLGYLVRLNDQRYSLSHQFVRLAAVARASVSIRDIARPNLEQLSRTAGESVTVFTIDGGDYVCVDVCSPSAPVMGLNRPGQRGPLNLGAASLVLMAYQPESVLKRILPGVARRMRHSQRDLRSILATVRKQEYAVSHGGAIPGISALSVPLFCADDSVRYSLNVVMPTARARGRIVPVLGSLRKAGHKVSTGLGAAQRE